MEGTKLTSELYLCPQDGSWATVNVCFGACLSELLDSPRLWRRVCNGGLIISVLGHMFIAPSLGNTGLISHSLHVPGNEQMALWLCIKWLQMCKLNFIWLMLGNSIKPSKRLCNEKQMLSKPPMQTEQKHNNTLSLSDLSIFA